MQISSVKLSQVVVTEPVCVDELDASWRGLAVQLVPCENEETEGKHAGLEAGLEAGLDVRLAPGWTKQKLVCHGHSCVQNYQPLP